MSDLDRSRPSNIEDGELGTNISPVSVPISMEAEDEEDVREGVDVAAENADNTISDTEKISFEKEKSNNTDLQNISETEVISFNPDRRLTSTFNRTKNLEEILENVEFIISNDTNVGLGHQPVDLNNSIEEVTPKKKKKEKKDMKEKKCRANYGVENKESWCKACRSKKRCTAQISHEKEEVVRPNSGLTKEDKDIHDVNINSHFLDEILGNYPEEVHEIFEGKCQSKRHKLFFSENNDTKRAKILNKVENQIPVI